MASLKEIKLKINSTKKTKKITAAMKLVAAAKVNKMQKLIKAARPYANGVKQLYTQLQGCLDQEELDQNPLLKKITKVDSVLLIVISSDIGLCGPYNANILKLARKRIKDLQSEGLKISLLTIGRKATDAFSKIIYKEQGVEVVRSYINLQTKPSLELVEEISTFAAEKFTSNEVQKVEVISTRFISMVNSVAEIKNFLPVEKPQSSANSVQSSDVILEPNARALIDTLTPMYLNNTVYTDILDATTSELASRMTAMNNASNNADAVIKKLLLSYNKARQSAITQEISEIVGGSAALA
ncbi:MAG: ATP synthase F1 subunit gamma [Cyanobacteria bacterium REEB446]|nr:ATP synthase F1 subunit gamma [Cyanobacteria bacterium REEB446]